MGHLQVAVAGTNAHFTCVWAFPADSASVRLSGRLDWGELWTVIGGLETKVYFSAVTLSSVRRFHAWVFDRLDAGHMYASVVRAFAHFGGSTRELPVDNRRALVLSH